MPIVINRDESSVIMFMAVIVLAFFIISVSSPIKIVTAIDTVKAQVNSDEIVANSITWDEFQQWMMFNDTTMYHRYDEDIYHCIHFSTDLRNNAQNDGIIIYRAVVWVEGNESHSINYGCFNDLSNEPVCALITPQTGKVFFNIEDYIHSEKEWNIISIIIKEGTFGENERSIKRIY